MTLVAVVCSHSVATSRLQTLQVWNKHAWLDVSTQAWTSHARMGQWVM